MMYSVDLDTNFQAYMYIIKNMAEPVDIDPIDHDEIEDEDDNWDDGKITEIEAKLEELRHFNASLETSPDKDVGNITLEKRKVKEDSIELVENQIYDKITKLINDRRKRLGIKRC